MASLLEQRKCQSCQTRFGETAEALAFYEKVSPVIGGKKYLLPLPTLCPQCREQRRMSFRNDYILHRRKSDSSGIDILSIYAADTPFPVYDLNEWWSDSWSPLDYGRNFDFSKQRIVEHMQNTGEWGEFFPSSIAPFGYNESIAYEHYPLTEEKATALGFCWAGKDQHQYVAASASVADNIQDINDDILTHLLACSHCGRNFKIIRKELELYRRLGMPVPDQCFYCRHRTRAALRNPRKLWLRTCAKCSKQISTTFAPERLEIIYCEQCYEDAIYRRHA